MRKTGRCPNKPAFPSAEKLIGNTKFALTLQDEIKFILLCVGMQSLFLPWFQAV
jgi:hypothetical protein